MKIVAIKVSTHRDLIRILSEVRKGNVIVASFSAFKSRSVRREVVKRILEAGNKLRLNVLGVGAEFIIIAPSNIKIKLEGTAY